MTSINLSRERSLSTAASDRALQMVRRDLARVQEQMSTGLRVNRASDDVPAFIEARQMEKLSNRYTQYLRSISSTQSWVDHTQDALDSIADRIAEAFERGIRANSHVYDADDREAERQRATGTDAGALAPLLAPTLDESGTNVSIADKPESRAAVVSNAPGHRASDCGDKRKPPLSGAGNTGRQQRAGRFELPTSSLGSWHSTTELHPRDSLLFCPTPRAKASRTQTGCGWQSS